MVHAIHVCSTCLLGHSTHKYVCSILCIRACCAQHFSECSDVKTMVGLSVSQDNERRPFTYIIHPFSLSEVEMPALTREYHIYTNTGRFSPKIEIMDGPRRRLWIIWSEMLATMIESSWQNADCSYVFSLHFVKYYPSMKHTVLFKYLQSTPGTVGVRNYLPT